MIVELRHSNALRNHNSEPLQALYPAPSNAMALVQLACSMALGPRLLCSTSAYRKGIDLSDCCGGVGSGASLMKEGIASSMNVESSGYACKTDAIERIAC